ncbi:MAG: PsbP-related protein [Bacteroidales bacterium]|nr:PsbP-related protein [Bacteroidales bacterium]
MVKHLFVVLTMCVLCNVVYSQQENSSIYHNLDFGYSIKYPDSWELEEYQENQSVSFYKQEENTTIMKHLQISVARWEDGDLAEFVNSVNLKDLENLYPDFKINNHLQEQTTCMYELSYTLNDVKVNTIFYFIKEEDNIYIFMAMAEDSDNYENDKETFMNIIESIELY